VDILKARAREIERAMGQTRREMEKLEERIGALSPEAERLLQKLNKEQAERGKTADV
jgi:prefoldin subunit 5